MPWFMPKQLPVRSCPSCKGRRVKKNGVTSAGTPRYRCLDCGACHTKRRPQGRAGNTYEAFVSYLLGKHAQSELDRGSDRSVRRNFTWCWNPVVPTPPVTGEVFDQVFIDGTYLAGGWVVLIACTTTHVLNWQVCARETKAAYQALLTPIAPPLMVVTDGSKGAERAINSLWPTTKIQRCLVHVHRNNITDLTRKPKTIPGQVLLHLSRQLTRITTTEQAANWLASLAAFYNQYDQYLKQRTFAKDLPQALRHPGRKWWYTHERDRRVYFRLQRLARKDQLFTWLTSPTPAHNTTNVVESHNAAIKQILRNHRGWKPNQQVQAATHYLNTQTERPLTPRQILNHWKQAGQPDLQLIPPATRHVSAPPKNRNEQAPWEDGLSIRKGWAGRYKP